MGYKSDSKDGVGCGMFSGHGKFCNISNIPLVGITSSIIGIRNCADL